MGERADAGALLALQVLVVAVGVAVEDALPVAFASLYVLNTRVRIRNLKDRILEMLGMARSVTFLAEEGDEVVVPAMPAQAV